MPCYLRGQHPIGFATDAIRSLIRLEEHVNTQGERGAIAVCTPQIRSLHLKVLTHLLFHLRLQLIFFLLQSFFVFGPQLLLQCT